MAAPPLVAPAFSSARPVLLRPDEVAEEEGDHEDDQQDLADHEDGHADPEPDADFLFESHFFHSRGTLSRTGDDEYSGSPSRVARLRRFKNRSPL